MMLSPAPPSNDTPGDIGATATPRSGVPLHPFQWLELQALDEVQALQRTLPAVPAPCADGLRALLGWDLGLSGDELP